MGEPGVACGLAGVGGQGRASGDRGEGGSAHRPLRPAGHREGEEQQRSHRQGLSVRAAITCHRRAAYKQQVTHCSSGGWKSQTTLPRGSRSGAEPLPLPPEVGDDRGLPGTPCSTPAVAGPQGSGPDAGGRGRASPPGSGGCLPLRCAQMTTHLSHRPHDGSPPRRGPHPDTGVGLSHKLSTSKRGLPGPDEGTLGSQSWQRSCRIFRRICIIVYPGPGINDALVL